MPKQAKAALRPYQEALVSEIMAALDPHGSVLLQLPTGGGKTRIATEIVRRAKSHGKTVWFVCHRKEILNQTSAAFDAAGIEHGLVKAGTKIEGSHSVWVCSVDALARRLAQMDPPDLMVWDEAHHIVARRWAEMKGGFREAHHLGLTATPDRLDGTGLRGSFNRLICGPDTRTLIDQGHLSPYRLFGPTIPDLRRVRTKMGDYDKGDVEEEMSKPVLVGDVVDHYRRLAPDARAIVFAISVKASQAVVERFRAAGVPAQHVDGKTPSEERDAAVAALAAGTIKVLSNVEVFTEGFDLPAIDAVILLRPTKSLAMYRQMVGRGLRKAPGKAATVILDHSGLVHEHGLPCDHIEWTLDGFSHPPEEKDKDDKPRLRRCPECSAIHATAAECVECGHVYVPEDRTIEEVYGELRGIHSSEEGERVSHFAERMGFSPGICTSWKNRGLPLDAFGRVILPDAEIWVRENARTAREDGLMSKVEFANHLGVGIHTFYSNRYIHIPVNDDGYIIVADAEEWLKSNPIMKKSKPAFGFEYIKDFAKRVGNDPTFIGKCKKEGLPHNEFGHIDIENGLVWIAQRREREKIKKSEMTKLRNADPSFKTNLITRSSQQMKDLHQDPKFAEKQSLRSSMVLRRLREDPEFERKRIDAVKQSARNRKSI